MRSEDGQHMAMTGNPQSVEDFDWEKTPEEEANPPVADVSETEEVPEPVVSPPREKKRRFPAWKFSWISPWR
jgi:hypothetical protein